MDDNIPTTEQMIKDARREARRLSKEGLGSHQECLDIIARKAGRQHWGDFMENPVDTRAGLPANHRKGQVATTLTAGAIATIPVIGAMLAAIAQAIYPGPQAEADREWMKDVVDRLNKLEEDDIIDIEKLTQDARFDRVVKRLVRDVQNEGEEEKRKAYKAVVINYAKGRTFEDADEKRMLGYLERYSALHLKVLGLMADPRKKFPNAGRGMMSTMPNMLSAAFPGETGGNLKRVYSDLMEDGLLSKMMYEIMMTADGAYEPRITSLGRGMLQMINSNDPATAK
jgi:hypothetical protein